MIAYKVLRVKGRRLVSLTTDLPKEAKLTYSIGGIKTVPKIKDSKIFVFSSLNLAKKFAYSFPLGGGPKALPKSYQIWKVMIPSESYYLPIRISSMDEDIENYREFWHNLSTWGVKPENIGDFFMTPEGTVGAKWVKLIKRVE